MHTHVHIDFETRSIVDLKKTGSYVYAEHFSTEILCLGYAFDDEPVQLWHSDRPKPQELIDFINSGGKVIAHNLAGFEYPLWNSKLSHWCKLDINNCECTMAMAYSMSLPGNLDGASKALGIEIEKDMKGHRIMLQLCKPREIQDDGYIKWFNKFDHKEKYVALRNYCMQDVEVERELYKRLLKLSPKEKKVWIMDHVINSRGVYVDTFSAKRVKRIVEFEKKRLNNVMGEVSKGYISTCSAVSQIVAFLNHRGVKTKSVAKAEVAELLKGELPDDCRTVLELRREAAKTSTAKLEAMLVGTSSNGRMKGLFQYHGATTGRFAGRRVQLQNLPRPSITQDKIDTFFSMVSSKSFSDDHIIDFCEFNDMSFMSLASDMLRGFLTAQDKKELVACDFSAIEARVLAWLAGQENVLDIFKTHGKIYEHAASLIYNVEIDSVTKEQRQVGKVAILALGYQGGVGAFQQMAGAYGVAIGDDKAEEIKVSWRNGNPHIVKFWYDLEAAAISAVIDPGRKTYVKGVTFVVNGSFLFCLLPSKRVICYPYPKIKEFEVPWGGTKEGLVYKGVDTYTKKWSEIKTYGGKLAENITQAVARDILTDAMLEIEASGTPIVMHCHDEIVVEIGKDKRDIIKEIMEKVPKWAEGLPLRAEGWRNERYQK